MNWVPTSLMPKWGRQTPLLPQKVSSHSLEGRHGVVLQSRNSPRQTRHSGPGD